MGADRPFSGGFIGVRRKTSIISYIYIIIRHRIVVPSNGVEKGGFSLVSALGCSERMIDEKEVAESVAIVVAPSSGALSTLSPAVQEEVARYKEKPRTAATLRAYKTDWIRFLKWCAEGGHVPFPASEDVIVAYLLGLSQFMKPASLERAYASIRVIHDLKKVPLPRQPGVYNTIKRVKRERALHGLPGVTRKRALEAGQVIEACLKLPETLTGKRDRVALLLGFAMGQRRAEIAAVQVGDLTSTDDGIDVHVRRSKTDQTGEEELVVPIAREGGPGCPVGAVRAWLKASGIRDGALIRRIHRSGSVDPRGLSPGGIAQIVKAAAKSLGLDPKDYGGHSLRRGFVTSAKKAGKSDDAIMATTGHKDPKTMWGYIDESARAARAAGRGLLATKGFKSEDEDEDELLLFRKGEERLTVGWVKRQLALLESRSMTRAQALEALRKIGVTKYGHPIEAEDV